MRLDYGFLGWIFVAIRSIVIVTTLNMWFTSNIRSLVSFWQKNYSVWFGKRSRFFFKVHTCSCVTYITCVTYKVLCLFDPFINPNIHQSQHPSTPTSTNPNIHQPQNQSIPTPINPNIHQSQHPSTPKFPLLLPHLAFCVHVIFFPFVERLELYHKNFQHWGNIQPLPFSYSFFNPFPYP